MKKLGRPSKYKLRIVHYLACHKESYERTIRMMTNEIVGKTKSTSSLQAQIGLMVGEGLVGQRTETIYIPSRDGRTLRRRVIVHYLHQKNWLDIFRLVFSSVDASTEFEWREWETKSTRHSNSFRHDRRREFLASDFAQNAINKNFRELRSRVLLRWWDFWASHYARELSIATDEDDGWRLRNIDAKMEALMKSSKSFLKKVEFDEKMKEIVALVQLSPSSIRYMLKDDLKNEAVPLFLLDLKNTVEEWVDEKLTLPDISQRLAKEFGDAFKQVVIIEAMHDVMTIPLELAAGTQVNMKEMTGRTATRSESLLGSLLFSIEGRKPTEKPESRPPSS